MSSVDRRKISFYCVALIATLAPAAFAFVTLTSGEDDVAEGSVRECSGADAVSFDCYEQRYMEMVRALGVAAALEDLAIEQEENGYVRASCHQLTHRIGRAAGEISGIAALQEATPLCASGYYHGVTQAVMTEIGADGAIDEAAAVCEGLRASEAYSSQHYNCVHGLGHGFMAVNESDVFESLDGCDEALNDGWEREKCYGGVFMENVTAINNLERPSRELRPNQPLYPCTVVGAKYKPQCYDWQMAYAVLVSGGDFSDLFELCEKAESAFRDSCYEGIGGDALQQSKFLNDEAARRETLRELCLTRSRRNRAGRLHRRLGHGDVSGLHGRGGAGAGVLRRAGGCRRSFPARHLPGCASARRARGAAPGSRGSPCGPSLEPPRWRRWRWPPCSRPAAETKRSRKRSWNAAAPSSSTSTVSPTATRHWPKPKGSMQRSMSSPARSTTGASYQSACHQLVHRIGRDAGAELGIDAFEEGTPLCAAGYYHGVTEAIMDEIGAEEAIARATEVCAELREADPHSADHYNCVHGMGHGFMRLYARDVFDSLHGCDALAEGWEREKCYSGVFMENLAEVDNLDAEYLDPERPLYPCTEVARRYKPPCYDRQTTYALYINGTDFAGVFELCETAENDFQSVCYAGLGGDAAAETKLITDAEEQARARVRLCFQGRTFEARSNCVAGAVRVALRDAADGENQAQALCSSLADARLYELHAVCAAAAERSYRDLPDDRGGQHQHARSH